MGFPLLFLFIIFNSFLYLGKLWRVGRFKPLNRGSFKQGITESSITVIGVVAKLNSYA